MNAITRRELKTRAKTVLFQKYWTFFLVSLLQVAVLNFGAINTGSKSLNDIKNFSAFVIIISASILLSLLINIFIVNPFSVSYCKFLIYNSENQDKNYRILWDIFKEDYLNVVKITFMRDLFLFLWSIPMLLGAIFMSISYGYMFIADYMSINISLYIDIIAIIGSIIFIAGMIPALYKQYSYIMTDYIAAENPSGSWREIISQSKGMMRGFTFFAFKLDLSFIGWYLIGLMLCGFGVLFVLPYKAVTFTQLYFSLRDKQNNNYRIIYE